MIKKILLAFALICPMLLSAQTFKMGLVDFDSVLSAMPETAEAQKQLQETSEKYKAEYQKLVEEMNRLYSEFEKLPESEPAAIKERRAREISDYNVKLQQFEATAGEELGKMQNDLMTPIQQKIVQAVESVGREGSYSLIQMYSPQLTLYRAEPVEDVTPAVKAKLGLK